MDLTMFIIETQKAVKSTKMTETEIPPKMQPFLDYLNKLDAWLSEVPAIEQPMRFGNKAFRTWVDKVLASVDDDLTIIM